MGITQFPMAFLACLRALARPNETYIHAFHALSRPSQI
jgi:hypothetical protein